MKISKKKLLNIIAEELESCLVEMEFPEGDEVDCKDIKEDNGYHHTGPGSPFHPDAMADATSSLKQYIKEYYVQQRPALAQECDERFNTEIATEKQDYLDTYGKPMPAAMVNKIISDFKYGITHVCTWEPLKTLKDSNKQFKSTMKEIFQLLNRDASTATFNEVHSLLLSLTKIIDSAKANYGQKNPNSFGSANPLHPAYLDRAQAHLAKIIEKFKEDISPTNNSDAEAAPPAVAPIAPRINTTR